MSGIVNVFVSSPDTHSERRIDPHITVAQLKGKLEFITGIPASSQAISILASESDPRLVAELTDDSKMLGYYGLTDWHVLKVVDTNPASSFTGQLSDVSQVEKFEISDVEYANRRDSVLAYKQRHKVGRFADKPAATSLSSEEEPKSFKMDVDVQIPVGSRCEVEPGLKKRGTVRFVGQTKFGKGIWVGIEYDEPFGRNDGSVQGERYFSCQHNFGVFVKPEKVTVGDFPVEEISLDDEEM